MVGSDSCLVIVPVDLWDLKSGGVRLQIEQSKILVKVDGPDS